MANIVLFRFNCATDFVSLPIAGESISVAELRAAIFHSGKYGRGRDFHLILSDAETQQDYIDDEYMLPKNSSVIVRRIPALAPPIVNYELQKPKSMKRKREDDQTNETTQEESTIVSEVKSNKQLKMTENCDEDLFAELKTMNADLIGLSREEEDERIRSLANTPALDWTEIKVQQPVNFSRFGRRNMTFSRTVTNQGHCDTARIPVQSANNIRTFNKPYYQSSVLENKTPPENYVCFRCNIPGHFIKHCPTNGDPRYDIKRLKCARGIPVSMLVHDRLGSYVTPTGETAVIKPDEAAFDKEMEGISSTRPLINIPKELQCQLCHEVMMSAVMTAKCCFTTYCDECIRNYLISNRKCACGALGVLADDLIPNLTVRKTINRLLESSSSSSSSSSAQSFVKSGVDQSVLCGFNGYSSQICI